MHGGTKTTKLRHTTTRYGVRTVVPNHHGTKPCGPWCRRRRLEPGHDPGDTKLLDHDPGGTVRPNHGLGGVRPSNCGVGGPGRAQAAQGNPGHGSGRRAVGGTAMAVAVPAPLFGGVGVVVTTWRLATVLVRI